MLMAFGLFTLADQSLHDLIAFITMLMLGFSAVGFAFQCDCRKNQRIGCYKYNHTGQKFNSSLPDPFFALLIEVPQKVIKFSEFHGNLPFSFLS